MYPYVMQTMLPTVDGESQAALQVLYGWTPQQRLDDRGTTDRATLGVTFQDTFIPQPPIVMPRMVWKGVVGDYGIYESDFVNGNWTSGRQIPNIGSSHSPALADFSTLHPGPCFIMAWKGNTGDQALYWSRDPGDGWDPHQIIPDAGSSTRPALANVAGTIYMACKGVDGDNGIYWSKFNWSNSDGTGWWDPFTLIPGIGTSDSPAIVGVDKKLFMFWKGIDDDHNAYWSVFDFKNDPIWRPQRRIEYFSYVTEGGVPLAIGTTGGLTATQRGNNILIACKGIEGDSQIYVLLFDITKYEFSGPIIVPNVGTSVGPSVVQANTQTLMAWKGTEDDHTIWWSQL
ncbi:hypothetical protein, partial [Neobacillus vireti]|uniref:hypothetical protein n=1 Tax=Neobacillus vireti TaxID=220686 RepID=UPI002FFD6891